MKKLILTLFTLSSLASINANADYLTNAKITTMSNAHGGWLINTATSASENPEGCSKTPIHLSRSHPQYEELYTFLLTAYVANEKVKINIAGCDDLGYQQLGFVWTTSW